MAHQNMPIDPRTGLALPAGARQQAPQVARGDEEFVDLSRMSREQKISFLLDRSQDIERMLMGHEALLQRQQSYLSIIAGLARYVELHCQTAVLMSPEVRDKKVLEYVAEVRREARDVATTKAPVENSLMWRLLTAATRPLDEPAPPVDAQQPAQAEQGASITKFPGAQ